MDMIAVLHGLVGRAVRARGNSFGALGTLCLRGVAIKGALVTQFLIAPVLGPAAEAFKLVPFAVRAFQSADVLADAIVAAVGVVALALAFRVQYALALAAGRVVLGRNRGQHREEGQDGGDHFMGAWDGW